MLDLGQLRSFREVAERGTVVDAARALGYTPPAVSQHIAKLEAELDVALFVRAGGRLSLTDAGHSLVSIAHEMADLDDRARAAVHTPPTFPHFVVAGFASAIGAIVVPQLPALVGSMTIEIVEAEDADAMRGLSLGTIDLVLTQVYTGDVIDRDPRFVSTALRHDELRLVLPTGELPMTRLADLGNRTWLMNGVATRCSTATERLLDAAGIAPTIGATVSDNTTLLALVASGYGVTIVPSLVLDQSNADVVVADEPMGVGRIILGVTRRAVADQISPLLDALREEQLYDQRSPTA